MAGRLALSRKVAVYLRPLFLVLIVSAGLFFGVFSSQSAHADGTVGNPGNAGGSSGGGGASTNNGYGWYKFNTDGSVTGTPGGMKTGIWSNVQQACRNANALTITAFIVETPARTIGSSIVYTYVDRAHDYSPGHNHWFGTYYKYNGNNGGYWQSYPQAQASFNSLPSNGVDTTGYTFGYNVGYFCSDIQPRHFNLVPSTTVSSNTAEPNTVVTISPVVSNNGQVSSNNTQWQLSRFVVPVGQSYPGAGISSQNPAAYFGPSLVPVAFGSNQSYPVNNTNLTAANDNVGSQAVGTKICYALSVKAVSDTNGDWAHGQPSCVTIAKKPKVQVWGSDLNVGVPLTGGSTVNSQISTSVSQQPGETYGSWAEYGVTATGGVTGMGSGAAYNGGLVAYNVCNVSQLIFTSAGASGCTATTAIGNYSSAQSIPDVGAAFPVNASTPGFSGLGDTAQRRVETATGTVNIGGGTVNPGDWLVLNAPTATVNITGDIHYTSATLSSLYQIPQLVIIANCINIAGGVQNVDAWLIAVGQPGTNSSCSGVSDGGVLNTCSDVPAGGNLSSNLCTNTLLVNGPVMARHLYMQRTAGAGPSTQAGDPAEIFNLRPDAYLWLAQRSITAGYIQAVSTTELPPRF